MIKNPLKYAAGGQMTQEQQAKLAAFIQWLPKRVKEFQGMQPEAVAQAINGMMKTTEGKKQVMQLLEQFTQENESEQEAPMFKEGGKIHDFICKHGRGGKTDCGCKQEGGEVEIGKKGMSKVEAINKAKEVHGFNNSQARLAYTNAKNALRNQGLHGHELRQSAREMISRGNREPLVAIDPTNNLQGMAVPTLPNGSPVPPQTIVGSKEPRMGNNYDALTFANAFRAARNKAGGDNGTFNWRGGKYTTERDNKADNGKKGNGRKKGGAPVSYTYEMPGLEPVVIDTPDVEIPEYEALSLNTPNVPTQTVSQILYPGLQYMLNPQQSSNSSWPIQEWLQGQQLNNDKILGYRIRNRIPPVSTITPPSLAKPTPMAFEFENGGVLKGQHGLSSGKFDIPFGAYMKAYFNKRRTPNVGAATNRSFGYSTANGNEYYLEDANIGRNSVDTWVNVTPKKDTIIMQKLPSDHINDLDSIQREMIMQRMRPDIQRVNNREQGGKVEKAQDGKARLGSNLGGIYSAYHNNDDLDRSTETIGVPGGSMALMISPSNVPERRDSLFIRMPDDKNATWSERRYSDFNSYTDNKWIPESKRGNFELDRSWWNYYKSKLNK